MSIIRIATLILMFLNGSVVIAKDLTAYDFEFIDNAGNSVPLSKYKGKVLMVVNTASRCGFTPQYEGLEQLWQDYKDKGLVVIAVPSNDFNGQEPGSNAEIKQFCETNYKITFPIMGKVSVIGDEAHPFYKWAATQVSVFGKPKWNFHKYVIGKDGKLLEWFASPTSPTDSRVIDLIESNLLLTQ